MKIIFFSSDIDIIDELIRRHKISDSISIYDFDALLSLLEESKEKNIILADYDSLAQEINKLISSNQVPKNMIVLEKTPEITSGKMLIAHDVKAYANIRISEINYLQMIETVTQEKVWTYPELTVKLIEDETPSILNDDAQHLIQTRLSPKEIEVVYAILDGLTNDAIAEQLNITTRTVKAHVSSIFSKLHINDRISLVLLLK